eukprot:JP447376.1.p1 GENE.JP447376.1~~JP447376.1.p1  ORF type:complete len:193 (+),score=14.50 JP447376.1:26-580(+)
MPKTALVPIANGSEEIEFTCIIDTLRRANVDVTVVSVHDTPMITASRGLKVTADEVISNLPACDWDLIALPGGMPGATNLSESQALSALLKAQAASGRLVGAICAAPAIVLVPLGILDGKVATAYPKFCDKLPDQSQIDSRVVICGNVVSSRSPGTALEFALALVDFLEGPEVSQTVGSAMLVQ